MLYGSDADLRVEHFKTFMVRQSLAVLLRRLWRKTWCKRTTYHYAQTYCKHYQRSIIAKMT